MTEKPEQFPTVFQARSREIYPFASVLARAAELVARVSSWLSNTYLAQIMLVLKSKHSLQGKKLLPVILKVRDIDHEVADISSFARLKKDHGLEKYTAEQLADEFRSLTGEAAGNILVMAGKTDSSKEALMALLHVSIIYANEVGAPKTSVLRRQSGETPSGSGHGDPQRPGDVATVRTTPDQTGRENSLDTPGGAKDSVDSPAGTGGAVADRVQAVESALRDIQQNSSKNQVQDALRHIGILASRPRLTSPAVVVAAVEALVDIATKTDHKDLGYYCKALQAVRRFEDNPDLCSLCQRLFGSQDDKKISSAIGEWSKHQKYERVNSTLGQGQGAGVGGFFGSSAGRNTQFPGAMAAAPLDGRGAGGNIPV